MIDLYRSLDVLQWHGYTARTMLEMNSDSFERICSNCRYSDSVVESQVFCILDYPTEFFEEEIGLVFRPYHTGQCEFEVNP
jgi:hypothetical protein